MREPATHAPQPLNLEDQRDGGWGGRGVAGAPVGTVQVDLPKFQNPTNQQTGCKQTSLGKPKFENEILQYL